MATIELYSANVCPYAQRTRLVLLEKKLDFTLTEIDLQHKPDWFAEVSPYGKVPALKCDGDRVWESSIINEYLEERFPQPALLPTTPAERAIARIWIDFANTKFTPAFYKLLLSQEVSQQEFWREELQNHLRFMEYEGLRKLSASGSQSSPFWLGHALSLVDLSFYPWFERFPALTHYRDVSLPDDCTHLKQWWMAMQDQATVLATAQTANFHIQQYVKYASNTASGVTAQELRRY